MSQGYNIVIVGAGIIGLATAYQALLVNKDLRVIILEKENGVAKHQSGHNSGVIHSGIYYKPGSLKARNCIQGYHQLIEFCNSHQIPFEICGKVIVATRESEFLALEEIYNRGIKNGLAGLTYLNENELRSYEPAVKGLRSIYVPQTGIIDYTLVCEKLYELILAMGGEVSFNSKVSGVKENQDSIQVITESREIKSEYLVNCAGLYSDEITKMSLGHSPVNIIPFRGEYYLLKKEKSSYVKNLIYPVPDPEFPFLGVHFTRMISGGIEAGPNAVLAFSKEGYKKTDLNIKELYSFLRFKGFRKISRKYWKTGLKEMYRSYSKSAFTDALNKLIPAISKEDLIPGGAGVRAQACDNGGNLIDDFYFAYSTRTLHVCNAPSPAATSSLAIGAAIVKKIQENYSL